MVLRREDQVSTVGRQRRIGVIVGLTGESTGLTGRRLPDPNFAPPVRGAHRIDQGLAVRREVEALDERALVIAANFAADTLYAALDPRVGFGRARGDER